MSKLQELKESLLSDIDNPAFNDDEKLILANKTIDKIIEQAIELGKAEHATKVEAPDGSIAVVYNAIVPDLTKLTDKEVEDHAKVLLMDGIVAKATNPSQFIELAIRLDNLNKELQRRAGEGKPSKFKALLDKLVNEGKEKGSVEHKDDAKAEVKDQPKADDKKEEPKQAEADTKENKAQANPKKGKGSNK